MTRTQRMCTVCGKPALHRCKYCGDTLCKEHLPPEMHWCVGLEEYKKDLEARGTSSIPFELSPERRRWGEDKSIYTKNPFGIFSGNYSFLLLFLVSISFVLQLLIPGYTQRLILIPALVMESPWTLITHIFLHGNFKHFFFNMLFFLFFGPVLERKIGSSKFLLIFFISGIVAGIGWSLTTVNLFVPVMGASGALMGIFGTLAVLMPRLRIYLFFFIPLEMWIAVILFALIDFLMIGSGDMIAHTAHLSGLFFGLLVGASLKRTDAGV
ncbi:MAG TPA: rhomboid family intramembrane serine protease [Candidatus Bathyarchaeia archaeon]|nr:rhomboid family intramembrane serine protease [Candidatus Bathyarchaeia archaeon]